MPASPQQGNGVGYSGLDFSSVGAELSWWLNPAHITQYFKGGFPGSGENGIDIGLPHGTPVYAILPGTLVGAGYYGGGGVESIQYNSQNVIYYQHLDVNAFGDSDVKAARHVNAGDFIGLSGGQLSGGNHPATCCSGGDHIEVGINAPFGGIWNPANVKPNNNPLPLLQSLLSQYQTNNIATIVSSGILAGISATQGPAGLIAGLVGGGSNGSNSSGHCFSLFPGGPQFCIPNTIYNWITQPIRFLKLIGGLTLIGIAALLVIVPPAIGPATMLAGAATGQPEIVAAGSSISSMRRRGQRRDVMRRTANRVARSRQAASNTTQSSTQGSTSDSGADSGTTPAAASDTPPSRQSEAPAKREPVYSPQGKLIGHRETDGTYTFLGGRSRRGGA